MKKISFLLTMAIIFAGSVVAQTKADIFNESKPITWLGLDFSQVKISGVPQYEVNSTDLREKYFIAWNQLFVNEKDKFEVAKAVNRSEVKYAINVVEPANKKEGAFFADDDKMYQLLNEEKISELVKSYDFKGNAGIGMMFFVEGMSKGKEEASMWATFVNMDTKEVLLTRRVTGKNGGFGFRNYWAKSFGKGLDEVNNNFKNWKKSKS